MSQFLCNVQNIVGKCYVPRMRKDVKKCRESVEVSLDAIIAESLHAKREGELFRRGNNKERCRVTMKKK